MPPPSAGKFALGATPSTREAQAIADEVFADFVSAEVDKVELVFTKFVSLIASTPTVQTLLPLTPTGERRECAMNAPHAPVVAGELCGLGGISAGPLSSQCTNSHMPTHPPLPGDARAGELCDLDGNCVDAADDEIFRLTTVDGKLSVEREKATIDTPELDPGLIFEQDPVQILDALLPLYMSGCLLRSLQVRAALEMGLAAPPAAACMACRACPC